MSSANRDRRRRNREIRRAAMDDAQRRVVRRRVTLTIVGLGLALVVGVALVARSGDDGGGSASTATTSTSGSTTTTIPSAKGKPCVAAKGPYPEDAPQVPVDVGPPPKKLIIRDLETGTGPAVQPGATISMNYILVACSTGKIVESSFAEENSPTLSLDGVIPGWTQGIPGMKVGGVRLLGIPPKLAYESIGQGSDIAPDETLWFVVKLVEIQDTATPTT